MAIRNRKPTSAGSRFVSYVVAEDLDKKAKAPKSLLKDIKHSGGRNAQGKRSEERRVGKECRL